MTTLLDSFFGNNMDESSNPGSQMKSDANIDEPITDNYYDNDEYHNLNDHVFEKTTEDSQEEMLDEEINIDKMMEEHEQSKKAKSDNKLKSGSLDLLEKIILDKKKSNKKKEELIAKKKKIEDSLNKMQYNLGMKYVSNHISISPSSGFIRKINKALVFGKSLKEKSKLLSIKLPTFNNYVNLDMTISLNGIYNKNNTIYLGIANKTHYWAIQRGNNKLYWHYNVYNDNTIQDPNKTVNYLGEVNNNLQFSIEFDKINQVVNMKVRNGTNEIEWQA